jgi:hypothetical protein
MDAHAGILILKVPEIAEALAELSRQLLLELNCSKLNSGFRQSPFVIASSPPNKHAIAGEARF